MLTIGAILAGLAHGRFVIEICPSNDGKRAGRCAVSRAVDIDVELNGVAASLLAGPAADEVLVAVVADAVDVADDTTWARILAGRL